MLMKLKNRAWSLTACTLLLTLASGLAMGQDEGADSGVQLTIGSKAPAIDVEHWVSNGNGRFEPVTEFSSGKVYIVEFWATWCGPCIASMPHIVETQNKYADRGVQIISVSDEDLETVEGFLRKKVRGQAAAEEQEEAGDGKEGSGEKTEAKAPLTYGKMTSAYCLTTDPDGSVNADYMQAAGQNGIPCCFIVGKTGEIEWIGHPMEMDEPLAKVVEGNWDRAAFAAVFTKSQMRDALMGKIGMLMQSEDFEGAMKAIEEAKKAAEGDAELIEMLDQMELGVKVQPILAKVQAGEIEEAMSDLDALSGSLTPSQKSRIASFKFGLLMQSGDTDGAAKALRELAAAPNADPQMLNQITWQIYETAKDDAEFSKELLAAATAASEKAVAGAPGDGMIIDTLAHLVHLQGDLDRAIELQTEAVKNPGPQPEEIRAFLEQLKKEKAGKDK